MTFEESPSVSGWIGAFSGSTLRTATSLSPSTPMSSASNSSPSPPERLKTTVTVSAVWPCPSSRTWALVRMSPSVEATKPVPRDCPAWGSPHGLQPSDAGKVARTMTTPPATRL